MRKALSIFAILVLLNAMVFASTTPVIFPIGATGSTNTIGGGTVAWTNPGNITANDGVTATCLPGTAITDDLRGGTFGFSIPTGAVISGIFLEINASAGVNAVERFNTVVFEGGGGASANRATATTLTTSLTTFSFGNSSDLWGTTWTPAQINAGAFVANATFVSNGSGPGTISIDFFRVTVTFTTGTGFMDFFAASRKQTQTRVFHRV